MIPYSPYNINFNGTVELLKVNRQSLYYNFLKESIKKLFGQNNLRGGDNALARLNIKGRHIKLDIFVTLIPHYKSRKCVLLMYSKTI